MKPKYRSVFLALATAVSLPFAAGSATAANLTWNGAAGGTWNTTDLTWLDGATAVAWTSATDSATFGTTGAGAITVDAGISASAMTFDDAGYSLSGAGITLSGVADITANADAGIASVLSGSSGLGKLGTGTLTLTGVNNYTGATDVTAGTLRLGDGTTQPTVNSTYAIAAGATLKLQYNSVGATTQTWSKFTGAGKLALASGKFNDAGWGESVALTTGFTGTLQIEQGRVTPLNAAGIGGTTSVVVKDGGQLGLYFAAGTYNQNFTIAGAGYGEGSYEVAVRFPSAATTLTGPITLTGNTALGAASSATTSVLLSGGISESAPSSLSFGASLLSSGNFILSGTNSYTGPTTINWGSVRFAKQVSLYNNTPGSWTDTNLVFKSGTTASFNVGGTGEFTAGDIMTLAGLGTASGGFMSGSTLGVDTTNAPVAPAAITLTNLANPNGGTNVLGFNKLGTGWLTLSGTSSYTGKTTVTAGLLKFPSTAALYNGGSGSWTGANINALSGATIAFGVGGAGEFTSANMDTFKGFGSTTAGLRTGALLGFDTTNASGGKFTYGSVIGTTPTNIGIAKLGSGILEMTASSTCTGGTAVHEGELLFSGSGSHAAASSNTLNLGTLPGSRAILNLASTGAFNYYATANVGGTGANSNGAGAIIKSGTGTLQLMNNTAYLQLGNGGYGSFVVSAGTTTFMPATTNGSGMRVGDNTGGLGVFTQTGGTVNLYRSLVVGGNAGIGPVGVATLSGGTLNGSTNFQVIVGNAGTASGTLNIGTAAGGAATLVSKNFFGIRIGDASNLGTPSGIINVNSGTVQFDAGSINRVNTNSGTTTGVVNLNGGTLKANAAGLTLIDNTPTSVNVYNGGVTVDTQANSATISANMLGAAGNGVYPAGGTLAVPAGGAGYIGAPIVTVTTSGSGTGATAIANVTGGVVTGVTLTSPGQGYQAGDTLSFAFSGGGSTTAATTYNHSLGAGDLAANGTGGLAKAGTGTLTLTGASTYGGTTAINAGTLSLAGAWANPNSEVWVKSGTTLQVAAFGRTLGAVTVEPGATLALPVGGAGTAVTNALTLNGTGNFTVRPVFYSTPAAGTYDLLVPGSLVGTAGTITTDLTGLGATRLACTAAVSGSKIVLNVTNPGGNLVWANTAANGLWDLNASANFTGATPGTFMNTDSVTFGDTAAGTVTLTGTLAPAMVTVDSSLAYTFGGGGEISGIGSLVKAGSGTLTISSSHSFSGPVTINGGVLSFGTIAPSGSNSPLGSGSRVILNGGILRYTGGSYGGDGSAKFDRAVEVGAGGGAIDIAGSGIVFCSSTLTGSGTLSIIDSSGDTNNRQWLYSGNSPAFTGNVQIGTGSANSGWVQYRSNAPLPFGSAVITVNTGGILSSDNGGAVGSPVSLPNNIVLAGGNLQSQGVATSFNGSITAATGTTSPISTGSANLVLAGPVLGNGTLQKSAGTTSVELRGNNAAFTGTYNHTADGATVFYTADSASAAASWNIPSGSNANARFVAGGTDATYKLGALAGTTGRVENLALASGNSVFEIGALGTNTTFGGTVQNGAGGTVGLTKVGSGTLALTGTVTYTGPTVVTAGTLQLPTTTATNPPLTSSCTVADGATLEVAGVANGIRETKSLILGSGGTTTLSIQGLASGATKGRLGVTETLTVNGPVNLRVGGAFPSGVTIPLIEYPTGATISLASYTLALPRGVAGTLVDNVANTSIDLNIGATNDLTWRGNNGSDWDLNTTTNWVLGTTPEKYLDADRVVFDDSAIGTTDVVLVENVAPASVVFSNATKDYTLTGPGAITGTIGLTKSGDGLLILATANTYTGATTVNGGILALGDGTNNGEIAGSLVNNAEVVLNPTGSQTYTGAISGTGTTITKIGSGTFVHTGGNTFANSIKVEEGTLQIGNGTISGTFAPGTYDISAGATLLLKYNSAVVAGAGTWSSRVSGAGTIELDTTQTATTVSNWGVGNTGTMFGSGFTGTLMVDHGRVDATPAGLGGVSNLVMKAGSTFLCWTGTYEMPISIAGQGWGEAGWPGTLRAAASAQTLWKGNVTLTADSNITAQDNNTLITVEGSITGAYECMFINNGNIVVSPTAPVQNSYGSTRVVSSGSTTRVTAGNAKAFSTGPLAMGGGALGLGGGTLALNGFNFTFANLSGTGGTIGNFGNDPSTLTVGTDGTDTSCAAALIDGGTGTLGLVKTGAGTLILTGANTFTGGVTLAAGALQIGNGTTAGSLASGVSNSGSLIFSHSSDVTYAGAISGTGSLSKSGTGKLTLAGTNTYTGNTSVNAGTLSLASAALDDAATVTVVSGAKLDLTTATTDVVGSLVLGGTAVPDGTYGPSHPTYGGYFTATSTGTITVGTGGYGSWAADPANGLTAGLNDGITQDPDKDGISNLLEYVLGGKPMLANPAILPQPSISGGFLVLTYKRSDESEADTTQVGRWSTDLTDWAHPDVTPELVNENGASPDDMVIKIPLANAVNGHLFGRLSVTK